MISKKFSPLSSGARKWLRPSMLIDAVSSCLRISSIPFLGFSGITKDKYLSAGRGSEGVVSVELSAIVPDYQTRAGVGRVVASANVVSGARFSKKWRVCGLPKGLVMLGKSPEFLDNLLVGTDFVEDEYGYTFYKDPTTAGIINSRTGVTTVDFYYLGGRIKVRDFPQFTQSKYGVLTQEGEKVVVKVKSSCSAPCAGQSALKLATCGKFSCATPGEVTEVWKEGDYYIGRVGNSLMYSDNSDALFRIGAWLNAGETLEDLQSEEKQDLLIHNGSLRWGKLSTKTEEEQAAHAIKLMPYILSNEPLQHFSEDFGIDTASNVIIQAVNFGLADAPDLCYVPDEESTEASDSSSQSGVNILKVWIFYGSSKPAEGAPKAYYGITPSVLAAHANKYGGCFICEQPEITGTDKRYEVTVTSLTGKRLGRKPQVGDHLYAIALETAEGNIYKIVSPDSPTILGAHVVIVVNALSDTEIIYAPPPPSVSEEGNLTRYWLYTEQDIKL